MRREGTMQAVALSESAVAMLRFRVRGHRLLLRERDRDAFRELVDAGIMEPDGADFKFTKDGWAHREEWLREAEERIERERSKPPDLSNLSESAKELLSRIVPGEQVQETPDNSVSYRELTEAGILESLAGLTPGSDARFRLTGRGWRLVTAMAAAKYLPRLSDRALGLLQSHLAAIGKGDGGTTGHPTEQTREAYRELARAGLMSACLTFALGPESLYRITEEAYYRREELLAIRRLRLTLATYARRIRHAGSWIRRTVWQTDRITSRLSDDAIALLKLHFAGGHLSMRRNHPESLPGRTVDETLRAYRELVAARLMMPISTRNGGPESVLRLTAESDRCWAELQGPPRSAWFSAAARSIRRAFSRMGSSVSGAR
jgi:hypothetical protein